MRADRETTQPHCEAATVARVSHKPGMHSNARNRRVMATDDPQDQSAQSAPRDHEFETPIVNEVRRKVRPLGADQEPHAALRPRASSPDVSTEPSKSRAS